MRALLITLSASALLACGSVESDEKSHIKEKHGNGLTKTEWRYSGNDSLNRTQVEYHTNGKVFISGKMRQGVRHGEWKAFTRTVRSGAYSIMIKGAAKAKPVTGLKPVSCGMSGNTRATSAQAHGCFSPQRATQP